MKNLFILCAILLFAFGCSKDKNSNGVTVSIKAAGLSDDKLPLNKTGTFTATISGYTGDQSTLSYRWTLSTGRGMLTDGTNPLPNATIGGNEISCTGNTAGEEQITVEALDASNNSIATASYGFTIVPPGGPGISRGCFDQPKIIYSKGASLYTCNFDGTDPAYTGVRTYNANISPDGEWIAYQKDEYNHPSGHEGTLMHLIRCDGTGGEIELPHHAYANYPPWFQDANPIFSPDSKTLYFMRPDSSSERAVVNGFRPYELVAYEIQTGEIRYLTSLYQDEKVSQFTVSPTTGEIAFIRTVFEGQGNDITLGILQPSTGFTQDLAVLPPSGLYGMDWSSDGKDLIYSRSGTTPGIYRINVTSGSQPILVFADPSSGSLPPLFPRYYENDTRIAWTGQENGGTSVNLWSIDANGGDMQLLLDIPQTVSFHDVLH